jgi:hypothetical protein
MLSWTHFYSGEHSKAARQADLAIDLLEEQISNETDVDSMGELNRINVAIFPRQIIGIFQDTLATEKLVANRLRVFELGLRIAGRRTPELVEPLQRLVILGTQESPSLDEWRTALDDLARIHQQHETSLDLRGVRAAHHIVGMARMRLRYELDLPTAPSVAVQIQLGRNDPYADWHEKQILLLVLINEGDQSPERTLELAEELIEISRRHYPSNHYLRGMHDGILAHSLAGVGRYREAEELALPAYSTFLAGKGPEDRYLRHAAATIVSLYQKTDQPEKLKAFLAQAKEDGVVPSFIAAPKPDVTEDRLVP